MNTNVAQVKQLPKSERLKIAQSALTMSKTGITKQQRADLWRLMGYDFNNHTNLRILENDFDGEELTLWLDDKTSPADHNDDCVIITISAEHFTKVIADDELNSYEENLYDEKGCLYHTRKVIINEPIKWYTEDAAKIEKLYAREAALKSVLTNLIEEK